MGETSGEWLLDYFQAAVKAGEVPYQSNRNAVKEFDIFQDGVAGRKELRATLKGIDLFIEALEEFQYAAEAVARRATSIIR